MEKKNASKYRILNYMLNNGFTTKAELSRVLNLSMPTVITNVNEMMQKGLIVEVGEMESSGGRKAKALGVKKDYCFTLGVDITSKHIGMVLVNLDGEVVKQERIRKEFKPDMDYCSQLRVQMECFFQGEVAREKILGVGISLPGIINQKEKNLVKSHALQIENYSLKMMEQFIPFPVYFENDANAAMLAENPENLKNVIYLSLNNTLGGALYINEELYAGQCRKAGEFGHMIIHPKGRKCYCGKLGCADAYCAASVLTVGGKETLDCVMERIGRDAATDELWQEYLEYLAILISNLRMTFDTDIILGGDVGGYLVDYMVELGEKIMQYNLFDGDLSYVKNCSYKKEASAVGAAKHILRRSIEQII